MRNDKVLNLLGLAYKAGKIVCGAAAAEQHLRKQAAYILLLAEDCGANNEEKYLRLSTQKDINVIRRYTKEQLGQALGRAQTAVVVLTDKGFADAMSKAVQAMD